MYVAHFYCDKCKSKWKTFYSDYESLNQGDACQVCTDDMRWGTIDEVVIQTHFFETVDKFDGGSK
jgi:DNA replicative helicase MCM subunit Mcm2 (Cdc46/Mcm family)